MEETIQNRTKYTQTQNGLVQHPEWNYTGIVKKSFDENKGQIQQILKTNPEIEDKRKTNQHNAVIQVNRNTHIYDAFYEFAEQTDFIQAWIMYVREANVLDPLEQREIAKEVLRGMLIAIELGSYFEAKDGWRPDYALCKMRMAMINFLLSDCDIPPYPPRIYKTSLKRRR